MQKEFDVSIMEAPASNVFNIKDPETYSCRVWHFSVGHSTLAIQVTRTQHSNSPDEVFFLEFDSVRYYEGPLTWHGANFGTTSLESYAKLLHRLQSLEPIEHTVPTETYEIDPSVSDRLFEVQLANLSVKIIASHVTRLDEFNYPKSSGNK